MMKKYIINIIFFSFVAITIYAIRVGLVEQFTNRQLNRVEQTQQEQRAFIEQRLERDRTALELKRLDETVKVLVRGKHVKVCMKDLDTDTLNNQVMECTKDHYIMTTRRNLEKYNSGINPIGTPADSLHSD